MTIPESVWSDLLERIAERRVIPVIGPGWAEVELEGEKAPIDVHLARRLAAELGLPRPEDTAPDRALFDVVACAHRLDRDGDYHLKVHRLWRKIAQEIDPPEELRQLAEIADFRLYLSFGFDDLLLRALDEENRIEAKESAQLAYVPNQTLPAVDLSAPLPDLTEPLVYALFGKSCAAPEFVISEEDLVEWVTALQDPDHRPPLLFDALRNHHLLLIGCRLPDWLLRFLIRMTRDNRFSVSSANETLIGLDSGEHAQLVAFLNRFSPKTQVLGATPQEFIAELAARWRSRRATGSTAKENISLALPADIRPGGVFLSYGSGDVAAAKVMIEALTSRQVDTFLDLQRIRTGADFDALIGRNIGSCGVFLLLFSAAMLERLRHWRDHEGGQEERKPFFFQEWELAIARKRLQPAAMTILPVRLDNLDLRDDLIPEVLRALSWTHAPAGVAAEDLIDTVRGAVRDARRQRQGVS